MQTAAPLARALGVKVLINPIVRERYAFACDVGTPRTELERAWPEHDFSTIDEVWWPAIEEPAASVIGRAALFRAEMAALPDWSDTLVVSHWGFILSMTGKSVMNGEWLRCDPSDAAARAAYLARLTAHAEQDGAAGPSVLPGPAVRAPRPGPQ